jgi:endonuclease YncB( thermonuclease family)
MLEDRVMTNLAYCCVQARNYSRHPSNGHETSKVLIKTILDNKDRKSGKRGRDVLYRSELRQLPTRTRQRPQSTRTVNVKFAAILLVGFLTSAAQAADVISGIPRVVDGDTIVVGSTTIRLESIDAPESDQVCLDAKLNRWTCGIEARDRLVAHIGNRPLDCAPSGSDVYGRTLAVCAVAGEDLNAWMVRQGWALAFIRYSKVYVPDEEGARASKLGLWSGAFIAPWDWRHRNSQTIVLGATAVPITARSELLTPESAAQAPSPDCIIKGNVNRMGERIYFRPGQLDYARVDMTNPGKRWFCTEDEAKAAGWRPAAR